LRKRGIKVMIGHAAENVGDAAVVVTSTAVKRENPEVVAALEARIPVVRRAEMLAELMRLKSTVAIAGTHGKTTTTSMVAALLDAGGVDPTVINGGIINSYGSNARLGASDWMVVEADDGRLVPASGRHDCGGDQYRPGASRPLRFVRQGEEQLCRIHRERALLWRGCAVHRPPRGAGDHPQGARPPRDHLWFFAQADVRGEA
jgi:hypothetical protein